MTRPVGSHACTGECPSPSVFAAREVVDTEAPAASSSFLPTWLPNDQRAAYAQTLLHANLDRGYIERWLEALELADIWREGQP